MRSLNGQPADSNNASNHSSSSSSPPVPRSGIVTGAVSSSSSSESSSASCSRRASRGRDSQGWSQGSASRGGADVDECEVGRARQQRGEAEEDGQQEEQDDEPFHKYAKPQSRTATRSSSYQQQQQQHPPPVQQTQLPVSSSSSSSASRSASSSLAAPTAFSLQSRVVDLEAQVAALQSQQRLFLAFMETTQTQLAMLRGAAAAAGTQQTTAESAGSTRGKHSSHPPTTQRGSQPINSPNRADNSRHSQYEYKDETADTRGRRSDPHSRQQNDEEQEQEEEEHGSSSYSSTAHSRDVPTITQRKRSARSSNDRNRSEAISQHTRPSYGGDRDGDEHYYAAKATNSQSVLQPAQRTPSRSPPPPAVAAVTSASSVSSPSSYDGADAGMESDPFPEQSTYPCPNCGRSFNESALERHVAKSLCQKSVRKPFDVAAQRLQDVKAELHQVTAGDKRAGGGAGRRQQEEAAAAAAKQSKWRQERARLQEAIQAGKQLTQALKEGKPLSSIPVAASSIPDDRVQCPHCLRKFAEQTAERHIPHCKNTASRMNATGNAQKRR